MKSKLATLLLLLTLLLLSAVSCAPAETPSNGFTPPEKPAVSPISVLFSDASVAKNGSTKLLDDGTALLEKGSTNALSFTVHAPEAGFYLLDLSYNVGGGYVQYLYLYNDSYPEWNARGEGRIGSTKNIPEPSITERDYRVKNAALRVRLDGTPEATVYLKKGDNALRLYIDGNATNTKFGTKEARLIPSLLLLDNTYTSLYKSSDFQTASGYENRLTDGSSLQNNGYFLRSGSYIYMDITVAESGTYTLSGLMSCDTTTLRISSPTNTFFPLVRDYAPIKIGDDSTSVVPVEIGTLNLPSGTHTIKIETNGGWLHFNMLTLEKTADFFKGVTLLTEKNNFKAVRERGEFTYDMTIEALDNLHPETRLTVVLEGTVDKKDGTRESVRKSYEIAGLKNTVTLGAGPFQSFEKGSFQASIYNANDGTHLSTEAAFTIYTGDEFRTYLLTDTHYTGTNEQQSIHNYSLNSDQTHTSGLKAYNGYTGEYDIYGWTSDEKLQRIIDDLILKYLAGEFDMVFFLGDTAMNDGNYYNFNEKHVHYEHGNVVLNNGVIVPDTYKGSGATHYGTSMDDFWNNPLNVSYLVKEKFLNQLSDKGIPYFCANGNHDYLYDYNDTRTALDYTAWENTYHYAELFGHKNKSGNYTDTTAVDYLVRVIRRNGEIKILSALSSSELVAFKERNKNDGSCYDFYVSEDTVTDSDTLVTAFMMVNGFQIESYKYYMDYFVTHDQATGSNNYVGQTVRFDYFNADVLNAMASNAQLYPSVYIVSHLVANRPELSELVARHSNIKGIFYGDVHNEDHYDIAGIPAWVVGYFSADYDIDSYYVRDPETGEYARDAAGNLIPDNQYYYDRGATKIGNKIWGDTLRHPFSHMILHVGEDLSYAERVHEAVYYENGHQSRLTYDWIRSVDPNYRHAFDTARAAGSFFTDGGRTVYVGGDVGTVGTTYTYIGRSYSAYTYNAPEYMVKYISGNEYAVYDLAGNDLRKTVTITKKYEGGRFTMDGTTYYMLSKIGSVSGHYLYDENGDYVYRTADGRLAYYSFLRDENGDLIKEYYYLNENDEFIALGAWQNGFYALKDGTYTDIRLYNDATDSASLEKGKYNVSSGTIEIKNGVIVRGEGFLTYSYAHTFVDGNGNAIAKSDIVTSEGLGLYIPHETYAGEWMMH